MLNYRKETKKPFKVFMTEDEWNEAVLEEFEKMNQEKGEESGDEVSDIKARLLDEASRIKEQVPDFDFKRISKVCFFFYKLYGFWSYIEVFGPF